jgi:TPR repeat protein
MCYHSQNRAFEVMVQASRDIGLRRWCAAVVVALAFAVAACTSDAADPIAFEEGVKAYDAGDYPKAYEIFRDLADNDVAAMRNTALMLRKGQGVEKNPQGARAWLTRAANAGLPTAEADLGEMLLNGEGGPPDPAAALPWLQLAAAANHPIAQFRLGEIYEAGQVVPRDLKRAKEYYAAAATRGVTEARDRLTALNGGPNIETKSANTPATAP